jgi:hypothetical protein
LFEPLWILAPRCAGRKPHPPRSLPSHDADSLHWRTDRRQIRDEPFLPSLLDRATIIRLPRPILRSGIA